MKAVNDKTPQAVQACHALLEWMIPLLDKFPRIRRFTLGERIESRLLIVLECLIDAAYSGGAAKQQMLRRANLKLETVRHCWRLSHELKTIPTACDKLFFRIQSLCRADKCSVIRLTNRVLKQYCEQFCRLMT